MKRRILMAAGILTAVVAAAAFLWGTGSVDARPGRRGGRMAGRFEAPFKALDLTAEQQEKMKALHLANGKEMVRLRADEQIAQMELQEVMGQDNPSPTEVKAKVDNVNKVRSTITSRMVDLKLGMKKILTPEQREKLRSFKGKMGMRGGPGKGMGMRGHRGMRGGPDGAMGWGGRMGMRGGPDGAMGRGGRMGMRGACPYCSSEPGKAPSEPGK